MSPAYLSPSLFVFIFLQPMLPFLLFLNANLIQFYQKVRLINLQPLTLHLLNFRLFVKQSHCELVRKWSFKKKQALQWRKKAPA